MPFKKRCKFTVNDLISNSGKTKDYDWKKKYDKRKIWIAEWHQSKRWMDWMALEKHTVTAHEKLLNGYKLLIRPVECGYKKGLWIVHLSERTGHLRRFTKTYIIAVDVESAATNENIAWQRHFWDQLCSSVMFVDGKINIFILVICSHHFALVDYFTAVTVRWTNLFLVIIAASYPFFIASDLMISFILQRRNISTSLSFSVQVTFYPFFVVFLSRVTSFHRNTYPKAVN